jgi:hypothetical protein
MRKGKDYMPVQHNKGDWSNPITHRTRHKLLHDHFDELMADYLIYHPQKTPSTTTLTELMVWSYQQTVEPDPVKD